MEEVWQGRKEMVLTFLTQALKHYTVTSDVERQSRVLQLLTQLVRLRSGLYTQL